MIRRQLLKWWHRIPSVWQAASDEPPLRSELFSTDQMREHGKALANQHRVSTTGAANPLLVRLDENEQVVEGFVSKYNMLDFNLGKTFFKEVLGISAGVKNLFNVTTIPSTGGSSGTAHSGGTGSVPIGWGRTFFIRAIINLKKI